MTREELNTQDHIDWLNIRLERDPRYGGVFRYKSKGVKILLDLYSKETASFFALEVVLPGRPKTESIFVYGEYGEAEELLKKAADEAKYVFEALRLIIK